MKKICKFQLELFYFFIGGGGQGAWVRNGGARKKRCIPCLKVHASHSIHIDSSLATKLSAAIHLFGIHYNPVFRQELHCCKHLHLVVGWDIFMVETVCERWDMSANVARLHALVINELKICFVNSKQWQGKCVDYYLFYNLDVVYIYYKSWLKFSNCQLQH